MSDIANTQEDFVADLERANAEVEETLAKSANADDQETDDQETLEEEAQEEVESDEESEYEEYPDNDDDDDDDKVVELDGDYFMSKVDKIDELVESTENLQRSMNALVESATLTLRKSMGDSTSNDFRLERLEKSLNTVIELLENGPAINQPKPLNKSQAAGIQNVVGVDEKPDNVELDEYSTFFTKSIFTNPDISQETRVKIFDELGNGIVSDDFKTLRAQIEGESE